MFSLLNPHARSARNSAEPLATSQVATRDAASRAGDESNETAERPATYDELLPYLMLAMVTAI